MIITIASAKGGAGKSTLAANIGYLLSKKSDKKTYIVDLDIGSPVLHIFFNKEMADKSIEDVLLGKYSIDNIMTKINNNLYHFGTEFGRKHMSLEQVSSIMNILLDISKTSNIIIDTSPGIHSRNTEIMKKSDHNIIIINNEQQSIIDNYFLIKVAQDDGINNISIIANKVTDAGISAKRVGRINQVLKQNNYKPVNYLGNMPNSRIINNSVVAKIPFAINTNRTITRQLITIVDKIEGTIYE